jgi:hypothetical protein
MDEKSLKKFKYKNIDLCLIKKKFKNSFGGFSKSKRSFE